MVFVLEVSIGWCCQLVLRRACSGRAVGSYLRILRQLVCRVVLWLIGSDVHVFCACGGIGRRAGFRFQCLLTWGFKSPQAHERRRRLAEAAVLSEINARIVAVR